MNFDVTLTFANGSSIVTTIGENGILLEGEEGRILVNRGSQPKRIVHNI